MSHRGLVRVGAVLSAALMVTAFPAVASAGDDDKPAGSPNTSSIDPAVLAEMQQQALLQPAVDALQEAGLDPASGIAGVSYAGKGLTLYYKGKLDAKMSEALDEARSIGAVDVVAAKFSRSELQKNADRISEQGLKAGSEIQSVEVATDGSGLTVESVPAAVKAARSKSRTAKGFTALASAGSVVAASAVDVPVTFVTGTEEIKLLTSRRNDVASWNGGGAWSSYRGTDLRAPCTLGFGVKNNAGERFVLTAAHCATPPDVAYQGVGLRGVAGNTLEFMGPVYQQKVSADILIIRAGGSRLIFEGNMSASGVTRTITGWGHWAQNQLVCQSGVTSAAETGAMVCGLRQHNSANITIACCDSDGDSGYRINGLIRTTRDGGGVAARGGDSGGPVYTISGSNGTAKGITSAGGGNTMYFQDWADVGSTWGLSPY